MTPAARTQAAIELLTQIEAEGLPAHALSVALRLADGQDGENG